mmetsp:Transcript_9090/g.23085  ORF Transcript_9090/g.23085 Transcript_9090/m.23085 type:complete len:229 (+) Transcript_9090:1010-1696(+)
MCVREAVQQARVERDVKLDRMRHLEHVVYSEICRTSALPDVLSKEMISTVERGRDGAGVQVDTQHTMASGRQPIGIVTGTTADIQDSGWGSGLEGSSNNRLRRSTEIPRHELAVVDGDEVVRRQDFLCVLLWLEESVAIAGQEMLPRDPVAGLGIIDLGLQGDVGRPVLTELAPGHPVFFRAANAHGTSPCRSAFVGKKSRLAAYHASAEALDEAGARHAPFKVAPCC